MWPRHSVDGERLDSTLRFVQTVKVLDVFGTMCRPSSRIDGATSLSRPWLQKNTTVSGGACVTFCTADCWLFGRRGWLGFSRWFPNRRGFRIDIDAATFTVEPHVPFGEGVQRKVITLTDVRTGVVFVANLANKNVARNDFLAAKLFDAAALGI